MPFENRIELLGNLVERLRDADRLERTVREPSQARPQPIRMVYRLRNTSPLHAGISAGERMLRVSLDAEQVSVVINLSAQTAVGDTDSAEGSLRPHIGLSSTMVSERL